MVSNRIFRKWSFLQVKFRYLLKCFLWLHRVHNRVSMVPPIATAELFSNTGLEAVSDLSAGANAEDATPP